MKGQQRLPNPVLYFLAGIYFCIHNKLRYGIKVTGVKPKGPALILSNHTSNHDHDFMVSAAYPRRISFMATYHWFTFKKFKFWLNAIGAIPKLQFTTDIESVQRVRRVIKKKGIVYIAPEGTVYANGKLGYINPSIAKLIKFLKVPVYATKIQGAGLGNAKWSAKSHKGNISIDTQLIINSEESKALSSDQIMKRIRQALDYNEFLYGKANNITTDAKDLAEGFETMYYICPCCHAEFTLTTKGNIIECTNCRTRAEIQPDFSFSWNNTRYFNDYIQWYDWQYEQLKQEILKPDFILTGEVDYGTDKPGIDNYTKVGHGTMTLDKTGWTYKGTFEGNELTEHDDIKEVPLATLKTGLHFELPFKNGHCRVFYPTDGLTSMKWHLASRIISELGEDLF